MKKVLIAGLIAVASLSAKADIFEQKVVQKVSGSEMKILEDSVCWGIIRKMDIPKAQPNYWAFKSTWYPNSKGQMIRINCKSEGGYRGDSYVEIVPAQLIKDHIAGKEKARSEYFKEVDKKVKASGVL